jgi:CheY-like chemotaxis protein/HPt (histidine-containing phosphotransfer) domain-containing protein
MNGILGMTELALDSELLPEPRKYLNMAKMSADALLVIINDILDFSKIEAGKLELNPIDFNVRQCLDDALRPLTVRAAQKNLELTCQIHAGAPETLVGDPVRLRQVIVNLVGNAIKFTERGKVVVECGLSRLVGTDYGMKIQESEIATLHFSVRDTGIGIPADKQQIIFGTFTQADSSTTRKYGGTGLGLAISKQLVELMGGSIWVESEVGKGSTFHFTARFILQSHSTAPLEAKNQSVAPNAARLPSQNYRPLRILLAEDHPVNQKLAVRVLEKQGHTVVVANNGKEALHAFSEQSFDLILMDVQMPEMGGYEATAAIREREKSKGTRIPIIAVTAHAMKSDRERCLAAGMDGYISKPIRTDQLVQTIAGLLPLSVEKKAGDAGAPGGGITVINTSDILSRFDGDLNRIKEVAALFLDDSEKLMNDLRQAISCGDPDAVARAAQMLRGAIGNFVAQGGAIEAVSKLEMVSRKGDFTHAEESFSALQEEIGRLKPVLVALTRQNPGRKY